jgi:hypothetical protein
MQFIAAKNKAEPFGNKDSEPERVAKKVVIAPQNEKFAN